MKKRRRYTSKGQTPTRRWHIPPPLIHGPETLEGGGILLEWSDELAVVLWQAFRDAMLWATAEPASRGQTFANPRNVGREHLDRLALQPELDARFRAGLRTLTHLVEEPTAVREEQVARACKQLSEFAYEQGKFKTALAFAQNAALASQSSPVAAYWVATIAFRLNDHARAEGWFRRAVGLARQSRDWRMYSRSFSGLGNLYIRRGNLPAARRLHTRALRGARRGGMRREQASALHDLFAVAVETGSVSEAEKLAREALDAFGTRNRRIHILAHDVAYFWMEQGHFGRALAVFKAVLPLIDHKVERLLVQANLVRAAGGVGDLATAETAAARVETALRQPELRIAAGRALLEVAHGYLSLGEYDTAEQAARGSLAAATEFHESKIQFASEALLDSIRERAAAATTPAVSTEPAFAETGDELAAEFVRTLEEIAGATA